MCVLLSGEKSGMSPNKELPNPKCQQCSHISRKQLEPRSTRAHFNTQVSRARGLEGAPLGKMVSLYAQKW